MAEATGIRDSYLASFARFEAGLDGQRESPLHALRRAAIQRFAEVGFPTTRDEEWRFTNVAPIARTTFRPAPAGEPEGEAARQLAALAEGLRGEPHVAVLVFLNGHYSERLSVLPSLPDGVRVGSLAAALRDTPEMVEPHLARQAGAEGHAFQSLNTAFLQDGVFICLPRGVVLTEPIQVVFASAAAGPVMAHPRGLIVAGESSQATIVERYVGSGGEAYLTNTVTEVVTQPNAVLEHYRLQQEGDQGFHVATLQARVARDSAVHSHAFTFGGSLTRNDVNAVLAGEGGHCTLNGLYMGHGKQLIDNHTRIDHATPHCTSHELYKGILADQSRGVFNGKIYVHPDAQKTDAKQTNQTLLLSDDAAINTKPQLEIFADDVRCTHGATVGQLDEDAIFYLRSRGIPMDAARGLLTYAFASEVVEGVKLASLRAELERLIFTRLARGPAPGEQG